MLYSLHEWDNKFIYSICLLHLECEFNVRILDVRERNPYFQKELDEQLQWQDKENGWDSKRKKKIENGKCAKMRKDQKKVGRGIRVYGSETFF